MNATIKGAVLATLMMAMTPAFAAISGSANNDQTPCPYKQSSTVAQPAPKNVLAEADHYLGEGKAPLKHKHTKTVL